MKTLKNLSKMAVIVAFGLTPFAATNSYADDLPNAVTGQASSALITLATTGNPKPLHKMLGGELISSAALQEDAASLLQRDVDEHLAPMALVTPTGETYAMVGPTITKDNFILRDNAGNIMRMDVGYTEGTFEPFIVTKIINDGGTPWYTQFWYWITGQ